MTAFQPLGLDALFALTLPAVEFAVDGLVPLGAATLLTAREKAGKGLLCIDACASVAFEEPFLDRAVKAGPAVYAAAEEAVRDVRARIETRVGARRDGPLFTLPLDGSTDDRLDLGDGDSLQRLANMVTTVKPVVVVLDVLRELHTGFENESDSMSPLLRPLRQMAHGLDFALTVTHHQNKGGTFRGSTAIRAAFDVELAMTPDDDAAGGEMAAWLDVVGRFGPRQRLRIRLGEGLRWMPTTPSVALGADTLPGRIVTYVAGTEAGATAAEIAHGLTTSAVPVALRTIQNTIGIMLRQTPPPVVADGSGTRGNPRRFRVPQPELRPELFPQASPPRGREPWEQSADSSRLFREPSGTVREESDAECEEFAL